MPKSKKIFYAFPSEPAALGETINNALTMLKGHADIKPDRVRFSPWTDLNIGGKPLIDTILTNIDRSDVFACDLTYLNANVSFELGYAIGRFKRVWISLNASIENAEREYQQAYFGLIGAGYVRYHNSTDLADAFLTDSPLKNLEQTLLGSLYKNPMSRQESPTLLYIKPPISPEAVIATHEKLQDSMFGDSMITDDPIENPSVSLDWYAGKLATADAVLCHLLGAHQKGHLLHNVKCSLIAGVARGLRKPILMLAENPFESPIDYRSLLRLHDTADECSLAVGNWIDEIMTNLPRRRQRRREGRESSRALDLRSLAIGEPVAENERQRLDNYFVETSTYFRAMEDPVTIVVGRRGVGKSAQLFAMQAALVMDRRNHVCIVKPVGYEIDGLVRVLQSIVSKSERGYLIESLWKFLIYSEIARSIYQFVKSRPPYHMPTDAESQLLGYYDNNCDLLSPPFSERLDVVLRSLTDVGELVDEITQRRRISELLHLNQLRDLRDILGRVLSAFDKVSILIDNLDAQWGTNANVEPLSELLWGLLQVSDDIVSQFQIDDHWRTAANVNLTIFLRSDIFAFIQPTAPEQDKLPIQRIIWDDPEVLKRLINHRLEFGSRSSEAAGAIWDKLFPTEVVGISAWDFVTNTVLPRPRDIVYLMREAVDSAINRGHPTVTPQDFLDARDKYSEYVIRSILAEDDPRKGMLEAVIYEFAGHPKIVSRSAIERIFRIAQVAPSDDEFYVDLLCDVNFLKIASKEGYRYARHEADRQIARRIASQLAEQNGNEESYEVSSAFWVVLQLK